MAAVLAVMGQASLVATDQERAGGEGRIAALLREQDDAAMTPTGAARFQSVATAHGPYTAGPTIAAPPWPGHNAQLRGPGDADLLAAQRNVYLQGALIGGVGLLLLAATGVATRRAGRRRLGRLVERAEAIAAGDPSRHPGLSGNDEVARADRAVERVLTELRTTVTALHTTRARLQLPMEAMQEGFAIWDRHDRLILCNQRYREMVDGCGVTIEPGLEFGRLLAGFARRLLADGIAPGPWVEERLHIHRQASGRCDIPMRAGRWLRVSERQLSDGGVVGIYADVSEAKRRELRLARSEARLRATMDAVGEAIVAFRFDGTIEDTNAAAVALLGGSGRRGQSLERLLVRPPGFAALRDLAGHGRVETAALADDRPPFPVELTVTSAAWNRQALFIASFRDITEMKAARDLITYQAMHDPLTGLPNRALLDHRLAEAMSQVRHSGELVGVLLLDLDRFKAINDRLGHAAGDAVLIEIARRLRSTVRANDTVARLGGDEFVVILRGLSQPQDIERPARELLAALRQPVPYAAGEILTSGSMGGSLFPLHAGDKETLLGRADRALYRAKATGRDGFALCGDEAEDPPSSARHAA